MADDITLYIDGNEIRTQPGKTIIQAAMDADMYIPYLCYYPGMKPFGACRMCVVEVENARGTPASCTTPVADGMVVKTNTSQLEDMRKGFMELIISEHPHGCLTCHRIELCGPQDICLRHVSVNDRCVTCPKNERCELKDTSQYVGTGLTTPLTYKYRDLPVANKDPFYDLDYNLCIVCGRCVRACEELRGDSAITFTDRAGVSLVGPAHGTSLLESGCEFCGACIDVCPVGALVERDYKWEKAEERISTTCPMCPVGCQLKLEVNKRGKVIRVIPELNADANHGQACFKGKFGLDFVNSPSRLTSPLIRNNGTLEATTWEAAIALIAERLPKYKGDSFATLASYRGTNEDNYVAQKFTRSVMNTNNVDHSSNTRPQLLQPLADTLGYSAATNPIWDLRGSECILVAEANVTEEHNVLSVAIKQATLGGSKLIVIDSREVELTRYADLWLRPVPGTDATLIGAILRVIFDEVLEDTEFLSTYGENIDSLRNSVWNFDLARCEAITGVSQDDIRSAARTFAQSGTAAIVYALETLPDNMVKDCSQALVNLAIVTGNIGKPNTGLYPLRPGTNDQGSWDVGCIPTFPNTGDSLGIGLGIKDMFKAVGDGKINAMIITGDSPSFTDGTLGNVAEIVSRLEFLVVQDSFLSPIGNAADVVLPSLTFAEKDGTFTNLERRVQPLRKAVSPRKSDAKPDWWITSEIAKAMGASGFEFDSPSAILDEISETVPQYAGITYSRLLKNANPKPELAGVGATSFPQPSQLYPSDSGENNSIQWPCPDEEHQGTPILYTSGFQNPKAKANLTPTELVEAPNLATTDHPFVFLPGRVLQQPERTLRINVDGKRNEIEREEIVGIHPEDASSIGIKDGDLVEIKSSRDVNHATAKLMKEVFKGTVQATFLFGTLATQLDSSAEPDPMSNVPRIIPTAVQIAKA